MGHYTALFGQIKLKPQVVKKVMVDGYPEWRNLLQVRGVSKHPDVRKFVSLPRSGMVAWGGSAYFDVDEIHHPQWDAIVKQYLHNESWENEGTKFIRGENRLVFFSSIKNYSGEYNTLFAILPLIADEWELFELDEDDDGEQTPTHIVSFQHNDKVRSKVNAQGYALMYPDATLNSKGLKITTAVMQGKAIERSYSNFGSPSVMIVNNTL